MHVIPALLPGVGALLLCVTGLLPEPEQAVPADMAIAAASNRDLVAESANRIFIARIVLLRVEVARQVHPVDATPQQRGLAMEKRVWRRSR